MLNQILDRIVQWCYHSSEFAFIRDSRFGMPLVQSAHLLGITILLGSTMILSLRLFGFGFTRLPQPQLVDQIWPWFKRGLALTLGSGLVVFLADPTRYAQNAPFRLKMALLCIAILYQFTIFRTTIQKHPEQNPTRGRRLIAAISLILWFSVGWCGRAIAFF